MKKLLMFVMALLIATPAMAQNVTKGSLQRALTGFKFSNNVYENPFVQGNYQALTSAQVGAGTVLLASASGKTIRPIGYSIYSSGAAAGATTVTIECTDGTDIAAIPVSLLTSLRVVGELTSAPSGTAQTAIFSRTGIDGCPAGSGVRIATTGSTLTGSTNFGVLINYILQ